MVATNISEARVRLCVHVRMGKHGEKGPNYRQVKGKQKTLHALTGCSLRALEVIRNTTSLPATPIVKRLNYKIFTITKLL